MKYTQQKYRQQLFEVNKIISGSTYIALFQLKNGDISYWLHIKKLLKKKNFSIKFCPTKLLKHTKLYSIFSSNLSDLYNGKLIIVFSNNTNPVYGWSDNVLISVKTVLNNRLIIESKKVLQTNNYLDFIKLLELFSYKPCQLNSFNKISLIF